jgi:plasmid maintenance system antidote protein VapI
MPCPYPSGEVLCGEFTRPSGFLPRRWAALGVTEIDIAGVVYECELRTPELCVNFAGRFVTMSEIWLNLQ